MTFRRDVPALTLLGRVLDALAAARGPDALGTAGADLGQAIGALRTAAPALLRPCALFGPLATCFELARQTGMTVDALERLRASILVLPASDARAAVVRARSVAFCLVQSARVIADASFASRDEVDRVLARLTPAFAASETAAADAGDVDAYRALVGLRAATVRDLTTRSRPLPRLVTYSLPRGMPALALAQRLFGDASRAGELVKENGVIHPLFCRPTGRALSA